MVPSSGRRADLRDGKYEPPRLVALGTLHAVTLEKFRNSTDGFSFTGPRVTNTSP